MDDLDWAKIIDIFKALTPFILALVVYLVWHKQKEKEVIANEAKNSLLISNEIVTLVTDVISCYMDKNIQELNEDEIKDLKLSIKEKFVALDRRKNDLLYSMLFIADAKDDIKLFDLLAEKDKLLMLDLFNLERLMTNSLDKINLNEMTADDLKEKIFTFRGSLFRSIYETKSLLVGYALYRI